MRGSARLKDERSPNTEDLHGALRKRRTPATVTMHQSLASCAGRSAYPSVGVRGAPYRPSALTLPIPPSHHSLSYRLPLSFGLLLDDQCFTGAPRATSAPVFNAKGKNAIGLSSLLALANLRFCKSLTRSRTSCNRSLSMCSLRPFGGPLVFSRYICNSSNAARYVSRSISVRWGFSWGLFFSRFRLSKNLPSSHAIFLLPRCRSSVNRLASKAPPAFLVIKPVQRSHAYAGSRAARYATAVILISLPYGHDSPAASAAKLSLAASKRRQLRGVHADILALDRRNPSLIDKHELRLPARAAANIQSFCFWLSLLTSFTTKTSFGSS